MEELTKEKRIIRYFLRRVRPAGNKILTHAHDEWELVYYVRGTGSSEIDGAVYTYAPGNFCLIAPRTNHSEVAETETDVMFVVFSPEEELSGSLFLQDDGEVGLLMEQLLKNYEERREYEGEIPATYLKLILCCAARLTGLLPRRIKAGNPLIENAMTYICDYFNTDISLTELAELAGYSYHRFRHIFREKYGLSPKQMIMYCRIDAVKRQLSSTDDKIEQIARSCGFSSAGRLNAIFKQEVGLSPREYRKKKKAANSQ